MKILEINSEWRIAVDGHGNYTPERYIKKEGGKIVAGKETVASEGWVNQHSYHATSRQAVQWICTKVNHEGDSQHILESLQDIVAQMKAILAELEKAK